MTKTQESVTLPYTFNSTYGNFDCGNFNISVEASSNGTFSVEQFNTLFTCGRFYGYQEYWGLNSTYAEFQANASHPEYIGTTGDSAMFFCNDGLYKNVSSASSPFPQVDAFECGQSYFTKNTSSSDSSAKKNFGLRVENNKGLLVLGMLAVAAALSY